MPSTRDIRGRIRSIRNIQQITRAMEMIASARLRKVQERATKGRPFADRLSEIQREVGESFTASSHPLLVRRPLRRAGIVAVTSSRGLCGGYNAVLMEEAARVARERRSEGAEVGMILVGRKGRSYLSRWNLPLDEQFDSPGIEIPAEDVGRITRYLVQAYSEERYDRIDLVYTAFRSMGVHPPRSIELLPIEHAPEPSAAEGEPVPPRRSMSFEPPAEALLDRLLPLYLEVNVYRALVESAASEQAARMVAMHNATESADEMIRELTKTYNRLRQSSITTEILEVVAGAESLLHGEETGE